MSRYKIYKMTTLSGFNYIGKTWNMKTRIAVHYQKPINDHVKRQIKIHGKGALSFEVLASDVPDDWSYLIEHKFIQAHKGSKNMNKVLPNYKKQEPSLRGYISNIYNVYAWEINEMPINLYAILTNDHRASSSYRFTY